MTDKNINESVIKSSIAPIFQILSSEQQILQRTDQKAFTLMSILGVFMVFFIVHFLKLQMDWFKLIMVLLYFTSALLAIVNLLLVIVPRIQSTKSGTGEQNYNITFFAGISKYKTPEDYALSLEEITADKDRTYQMFSNQLYFLGKINAYKNKALKRAIMFFATAIISELLIIMSMAWAKAIPYLFPAA